MEFGYLHVSEEELDKGVRGLLGTAEYLELPHSAFVASALWATYFVMTKGEGSNEQAQDFVRQMSELAALLVAPTAGGVN